MVRIFNVHFPGRTLFLGVSETLLTCLAFLLSFLVWYGRDANLVLTYEGGFARIALVTLIFFACMYYLDMYDSLVLTNRREVLTRLIQVAGFGSLVLGVVYYAFPDMRLSFGIFVMGVFLLVVTVSSWRELFFWVCRWLKLAQRTVVLGEGRLAMELASEVEKRPEAGIQVLGYVNASGVGNGDNPMRYLGGVAQLPQLVRAQKVERLIVAMADRRGRMPIEQLLDLKAEGIQVQDGADLYEALTGKVPLASLRLSWLLFSSGFRVSPYMLFCKRLFSILLSSALLLLCAPLMLLIAILVRLDSPGPVIFRQTRVGERGKHFTLFKFRTMYEGSDAGGNHRPAQDHDERFTRVGRWLRRARLDELPQLYNILIGDMYFVGPRPFVPDQEEECVRHIPFYRQRWAVKPGATGWAQVHHGYCATLEDNSQKLAYDLFYIKNMSIGLDLLIVFETLKTLLLGRGGR